VGAYARQRRLLANEPAYAALRAREVDYVPTAPPRVAWPQKLSDVEPRCRFADLPIDDDRRPAASDRNERWSAPDVSLAGEPADPVCIVQQHNRR